MSFRKDFKIIFLREKIELKKLSKKAGGSGRARPGYGKMGRGTVLVRDGEM
jgi:hypothetical protein